MGRTSESPNSESLYCIIIIIASWVRVRPHAFILVYVHLFHFTIAWVNDIVLSTYMLSLLALYTSILHACLSSYHHTLISGCMGALVIFQEYVALPYIIF